MQQQIRFKGYTAQIMNYYDPNSSTFLSVIPHFATVSDIYSHHQVNDQMLLSFKT
jgi:hypothetical protein